MDKRTPQSTKTEEENLVSVETEDGDTVIYDRDSPSSAWIRSDRTIGLEK
ncbi:DUF7331 family protein [Halococcoides cellulosivorans]|nr:hypothetical protein [Halococcoides cellulosivorans]